MYGASDFEKATVVAGKLAHYTLLGVIPFMLHGGSAALIGAMSYYFTQANGDLVLVLGGTPALGLTFYPQKCIDDGMMICTAVC